MASLTLEGYLTKTQIKRQFGRHPRTLTKDVSKSLECRDEELLSLCRLKRQSGEVLEGTTVTPELRDNLVEEGENPQWYFLPEFVETVVKRQSPASSVTLEEETMLPKKKPASTIEGTQGENLGNQAVSGDVDLSMPQLPKDAEERATILQHLYLEKSRELIKERSRYDDLLPIIKDIPKQTEKMVEAMQGLQALFANTQEREKALNPGKAKETLDPVVKKPVVTAEVIEADVVVSKAPTKSVSQPTKSSTVKKPRTFKKKRSASRTKSTMKTAKPATKTSAKKPATFAERNLPSLVALFGRRSK